MLRSLNTDVFFAEAFTNLHHAQICASFYNKITPTKLYNKAKASCISLIISFLVLWLIEMHHADNQTNTIF